MNHNCFIAAGSVVTKSIPVNCIAGGVPAKVICTLEDYYNKRLELCKKEAFEYAQSISEHFNRRPVPADFWEEFPLFVNKSNINQYPDIPIERQLGRIYPIWIEKHESVFHTFEEFIEYALKYNPHSESNK